MARETRPAKRIPVIIDTDPGVDDVLAILLALSSPELDVRAIIITFGNTDVDAAYLNILKLHKAIYKLFEVDPSARDRFYNVAHGQIILARGTDRPLEGEIHSAQYFHGRDGLGGISERHPDLNVVFPNSHDSASFPNLVFSTRPGADVALDILKEEDGRSVTYIVLGPMTTLAHLSREHGDVLRERIGRVLCMGGALDVPGNTSPVAEFNFFADPFAVHELLCSSPTSKSSPGLPLDRFLLIPLDTSTPHELPFPYYTSVVDPAFHSTAKPSSPNGKNPVVHLTSSFLERTREVMLAFGKDAMELHDIVVVWCAVENPEIAVVGEENKRLLKLSDGWSAIHRRFEIERAGELTRGMLVVDRRDDVGAYNPGSNRAEVQAELEKHSFQPSGTLESTAIPAPVVVDVKPATEWIAPEQKDLGIPVVVSTPGAKALLSLLTKRVWGIDA